MSLWRLPEILTIQLKRFSFRNLLWRDKIDQKVHFPVEYALLFTFRACRVELIMNANHVNVCFFPTRLDDTLQTAGSIALLVEHLRTRSHLRSLCRRQSLRRYPLRSLHMLCSLSATDVRQ